MSITRPLTEIEARWLLPRIRSTRRALRIGWLVARWIFLLGGIGFVGLGIYGMFDGEWGKSLVILPFGLVMAAIGFILPTGKAPKSDSDSDVVVRTLRGEIQMVRVPAGKTHTYVPTFEGDRPLMLPPGWGDEFPEYATVEFEAVEASAPGLHSRFYSALYVVSVRGQRHLEAELLAGLEDGATTTALSLLLVVGVVGLLIVLPLQLWPSFGAAYDLTDIPDLLQGRPPVVVNTWHDLQAKDPRPGEEIELGPHVLVDWRESREGGVFADGFDGRLVALPDSGELGALHEGLARLRARMEAVRALRSAELDDTSGALHRRLGVLEGNPSWETFEANRVKVLRSWRKDPAEAEWNLGWLRSELFADLTDTGSFVGRERTIGDSLWSRALLEGFGLRVSMPERPWFPPEGPRRAWLQTGQTDEGRVIPLSLSDNPQWCDPHKGQLWTRWFAVEDERQLVRPAGLRAVVRQNALGNDFLLVARDSSGEGHRRYLGAVFGISGGVLLYLLLGGFFLRRYRAQLRRCAAASRAHWEARR